jgi:hypothetical protein
MRLKASSGNLAIEVHLEFGVTPHPLETTILLIHGVIAILSMYLFGWTSAHHILRSWPVRARRLSGGSL